MLECSAHDDLIEVGDFERQTERRALLIYDGACGFVGLALAMLGPWSARC